MYLTACDQSKLLSVIGRGVMAVTEAQIENKILLIGKYIGYLFKNAMTWYYSVNWVT